MAVSQSRENSANIGISIPVIWNNAEATYYQLGSPKYPSGKATSYGINVNFNWPLYKGIYGKIGIGYFKQNFGIKRPFLYESPVYLLYSTDSYHYDNAQIYGGIGYKWNISNFTFLNGYVIYNQYYSIRQKYVNLSPVSSQVSHKSISLGRIANIELGAGRRISEKVSVAANIVFPFYIHWNNDEIFINNYYSNDEQQIARNRFSLGAVFSCYYNF